MAQDNFRPRNHTARTLHGPKDVIGNPVTSRFESAVANCFPGLEFDIRILETRFFPGLLFRFVVTPLYPDRDAIPNQQGVRLLYIDYLQDPMLPETSNEKWIQDLLKAYGPTGKFSNDVATGRWYLDWVEQAGKRLAMSDDKGYYEYEVCWRIIRGLEPDEEVRIGLVRRDAPDPKPRHELVAPKRRYVNSAGVYDLAYRPGELTEAMCNPWTHDFRDCACHYWASNHPDVVVRDVPDRDGAGGPTKVYVDWLSTIGRSATIPAFGSIAQNRPFQIDHYEINQKWQDLPFVLEGREIDGEYAPPTASDGEVYPTPQDMIEDLECNLAGMELTLALQYLYALFSLRDPRTVDERKWPGLAGDLTAIREFVLLVAVGEMAHLRWVNQILWLLYNARLGAPGHQYRPIVEPAAEIPTLGLRRSLRPLDPATLDDFIAIERPSGAITRAYGRCVATLGQKDSKYKYPPEALEIAMRIDGEGLDHYERFLTVRRILQGYGERPGSLPYLRNVVVGRPEQPECIPALDIFSSIRQNIRTAYAYEAAGNFSGAQGKIWDARQLMQQLMKVAEDLAERGIGVPFWND
jgi:Ferritin-like